MPAPAGGGAAKGAPTMINGAIMVPWIGINVIQWETSCAWPLVGQFAQVGASQECSRLCSRPARCAPTINSSLAIGFSNPWDCQRSDRLK